ncbi:MAG: pitrilysin family protein [Candidatus Omnitrophica bacterium]|nr:pitrilysin family protein [Candidatus Omnitrophota bacterium]MDD5690154.1 pitrilysin family protein [Candidatus Omnitrophota bacterium]
MYRKSKLSNGLRIITKRLSGVGSISLGIWINIGGRYEPDAHKGISHYLEHLLFKGSKKYSCRQIKELIEGVGGALNGFTSEELTCYLVKIPSRYLVKSLDILSDMVVSPCLKREDIKKERTVILEELKMYRDLPQSYVYELLDELLWPNQAIGSPVIGTIESVKSITRDNLSCFQRTHYTPANIVISASGLIDHNLLVKKVSGIFADRDPGGLNAFTAVREFQDKQQLKIFHKTTEQTHMALGFHGLKRDHPLRHAQALLHIILGANMSSRLFNEVREKRGLAYEIGSGLKRYHDTGAFLVHAGIDNHKVLPCLELIFKELGKAKNRLVTADEFRRAKEFYMGQLMLALEDTMEYMLWMGESMACLDKVYTLEDVVREVNKVTIEDLQKVARKIFKREKINLALIGPLEKEKKRIYSELNLG